MDHDDQPEVDIKAENKQRTSAENKTFECPLSGGDDGVNVYIANQFVDAVANTMKFVKDNAVEFHHPEDMEGESFNDVSNLEKKIVQFTDKNKCEPCSDRAASKMHLKPHMHRKHVRL